MKTTETNEVTDQTSYVCLFHNANQAEGVVRDLTEAGIPKASIGLMGNSGTGTANPAAMEKWRIPQRDAKHLMDEIHKGGMVVAVSGRGELGDRIESIFKKHQASQIDETGAAPKQAVVADPRQASKAPLANGNGTINVIEEELAIGKRRVQTGGVRIFSRVVETPVNECVSLEEEHVHVDRHAVNRPGNAADGDLFRERSMEMTESGEQAVVSKSARVVEEVSIGKETTNREECITDNVRHTEVNVEELAPEVGRKAARKN